MTTLALSDAPVTTATPATAYPDRVQVPVSYRYMHAYRPPRCRNDRHEERVGETTMDIRRVTDAEAPVAMRVTRVPGVELESWEDEEKIDAIVGDYRWFAGQLWRPSDETAAELFADPAALGRRHSGNSWRPDPASIVLGRLRDWAASRLFIGDVIYEASCEPAYHLEYDSDRRRYVVLDVVLAPCVTLVEAPGKVDLAYYRADQDVDLMQQVEAHRAVWTEGPVHDPERFEYRPNRHHIEVVIPEAVQLSFRPSASLPQTTTAKVEASITTTGPLAMTDYGEPQGFKLPDGRLLVLTLAYELVDPANQTRVLVTAEEAEAVGLAMTDLQPSLSDRERY